MHEPEWSAILEVQDPDGTRTRHPFQHPRMRVGRRGDNDLSLADEGVSHQHCEFVSEQGFFLVRDVGSHNGTFVNQLRVGEARLRDGDEVRIGGTRIKIALQGKVRKPPGRVRWRRVALAVLAVAGPIAVVIPLWHRERELRGRYAEELRHAIETDACTAPQFAQLSAFDAQTAGRSFAIGSISAKDRETNELLLALFRKKLALHPALLDALTQAQQSERETFERLSRLGQRFLSAKDRRVARWADGLLQGREQKADDLAQGVRAVQVETAKLVALVEAVLVRGESAQAPALAQFRFATDLRALQQACRAASERTAAAASGALTALGD